jgi:two-component system, OmpR family, sensor histidine kinase MtrB
LLDNARDHGQRGSPVEVELQSEPDGVWIAVADQGPGIDQGDLATIFEPFYRASLARGRAPSGVGLGLSIARRITEALGGRLEVESEIGRGSRFIISLSAARLIEPTDVYERSCESP